MEKKPLATKILERIRNPQRSDYLENLINEIQIRQKKLDPRVYSVPKKNVKEKV